MSGKALPVNVSELEQYSEAVRDALTTCRYKFKGVKRWHAHYIPILAGCERDTGRITAGLVVNRIITGQGQMGRIFKGLVSSGLLTFIPAPPGKRYGAYYILTEKGHAVNALYVATFNNRLERLRKHIAKRAK